LIYKQKQINISVILVSFLSIISISIILHNASAEEFNAKKLGLKFEYDEHWKLSSGADSSTCDRALCVITFKNINNDNTFLKIWIQKGGQFKNICKCDTLVEFVQYDFKKYYEPIKTFSLINDNQTILNGNISAMNMEYTSIAGETKSHYLITWLKNNDIYYRIVYQSDNNNFKNFLSNIKTVLNTIELFDPTKKFQTIASNDLQPLSEKKQPSFMSPNLEKEETNQKESINKLGGTNQQQLSGLMLYEDPKGRFTFEYDPSLWIAIPDKNRFDEIEVTFADKETGGKDVGATVAIVKDPRSDLSIKEQTELTLPSYIGNNEYEDRQLEEGIECEKMTIQGYDTCSFIISYPKSYFDTYPRIYLMIASAKIGDKLWLASFTALGDQFEKFEQSMIQMINSMKIITTAIK
jgi:hypothetical protein